ncbi:ABC transporter substrate-binding protein [Microbacterium trichothecenolyticum]|uniref:ABC transporter substrate-binding protein n=1 Tax=Microbacterium trichothecenolyticum TaxID=69370 RepID=UPI0035BE8A5C
MKTSRKMAAAVAAAAMVSLAGCSAGSAPGSTSEEVTMWIYPVIADEAEHRAFWDKQISEFEAEHEGVTVNLEIFPWANRDEGLTTAILSGTAPDVVYFVPDQIPAYVNTLRTLDDVVGDRDGEYRSSAPAGVTYDGHAYGAPVLMNSYALLCNKSVLDQVGVDALPTTWDEFTELGATLKEAGFELMPYNGNSAFSLNISFYPWLWQAGGSVFTESGDDVAFDSPEGLEAITYLRGLVTDGYMDQDALTVAPPMEQSGLALGTTACTTQHVPQEVEPFWGEENILVGLPLSEELSVGYGAVSSLAVLKDAPDAAAEWVAFATRPEALEEFNELSGYFSPYADSTLHSDSETYAALEATLDSTTVGELHVASRKVMGAVSPELQAALLGQTTPEDALAAAAEAARQVLAK